MVEMHWPNMTSHQLSLGPLLSIHRAMGVLMSKRQTVEQVQKVSLAVSAFRMGCGTGLPSGAQVSFQGLAVAQ